MGIFKNRNNPDTDTAHLSKNLGWHAARALASVAVAQVFANIIGLGGTVVLARLLGPEEFGLMALLATAVALLTVFENFGLYFATIQKKVLSHDELNFLFWANLGVAFIIASIMFLSAPFIAAFFNEPELVDLARILGLAFIFRGAANQHAALLNRKLQQAKSSSATVIAVFFATAGAIIMALSGFGVWALVWRQVIEAFVRMVSMWCFTGWIPRWVKWRREFAHSVKFGVNVTFSNLMYYFSRNADDILIGKYMDATALGHYKLSYQILLLPLKRINEPVSHIMIPMLSQLQDQAERYKRNYMRIAHILVMMQVPVSLIFAFHAEILVSIIFGAQWIAAAAPLRWLASLLLIQGISASTGWLFISQARSKEMLYWSIFASVTTIISFLIGLPYGIEGVAACYVIGAYLRMPILFQIIGREGPVSTRDLYGMVWAHLPPIILFSAINYAALQVIGGYSPIWQIIVIFFVGLSFIPTVLLFPNSRRILFQGVTSVRETLLKRKDKAAA